MEKVACAEGGLMRFAIREMALCALLGGCAGLNGGAGLTAVPPFATGPSQSVETKDNAPKTTGWIARGFQLAGFGEAEGGAASDQERSDGLFGTGSFQQLLVPQPVTVDIIIGQARWDEAAGRVSEAEQGFLRAARWENSSARSLDALGQFYTGQGRWSQATSTLQRAVAAAPADSTIRFHYGIALARSGQFEKAEPELAAAVGAARAQFELGMILFDRQELAASEERFLAAVVAEPGFEPAQRRLAEVREKLRNQTQVVRHEE
ncbi:MAG: tetratricopeptide repeat protein [Planctomycetales bacterium]